MKIYDTFLLSLDIDEVNKEGFTTFLRMAPKMYKVYSIPKRTHGHRIIAHPAKFLKKCQRVLNDVLVDLLPINKAAFAYIKNISIRDNAELHKNSKYLLKMDFSDFFNSITPELLFSVFESKSMKLEEEDKFFLQQLLFWSPSKEDEGKLVLSVGAPSSPLISNFIMTKFDELIGKICEEKMITYSRYADDIFFSTNEKNSLFDLPKMIRALLKGLFGNQVTINESKTIFSSKAHNRYITGITITNDGDISLGRKRKRYISSLVHKFQLKVLDQETILKLQGLLSFAKSIEINFIIRLEKKYSYKTLNDIYKYRLD